MAVTWTPFAPPFAADATARCPLSWSFWAKRAPDWWRLMYSASTRTIMPRNDPHIPRRPLAQRQIGRASCRARVYAAGEAGGGEKRVRDREGEHGARGGRRWLLLFFKQKTAYEMAT